MKFTGSELQDEFIVSAGNNLGNIGLYILDYEGILEGNSNYQLNDSMWGFSLALGLRVQKQSLASLAGICSGRKGCSILMKISLQLFLGNSLILKVEKSLLFEKPVQIVSIAVAWQYLSKNLRKQPTMGF